MQVLIRPIKLSDTENIIRWRNNSTVKKFFIDQSDLTSTKHKAWMENYVLTGQVSQFIIVCDEQDIGSVYLRDIDIKNKKAEFGIFIGDDSFRGKGVGKCAIYKILDFSFIDLLLNKVFLRVLTTNKSAIKLYTSIGFKEEGVFRQDVVINNEFSDILFMSILKNEWQLAKENLRI